MAGVLRAQGMEEDDIYTMLQAVNLARCKPELPENEVRDIACGVCRYAAGRPLVEPWDGSGSTETVSGGKTWHSSECSSTGPLALSEWEIHVPLQEYALPDFPVGALPQWMGDFVSAVADFTQTPPDVGAMIGLAAVATACARTAAICLGGDWLEPLNIYAAVVLPPASRKSAVFSAFTNVITEFEQAAAEIVKPERAKACATRALIEGRIKKLQRGAESSDDEGKVVEEIERLSRQLEEIEIPEEPRLFTDDCTPEMLGALLARHNGRMAVLSAEGEIFEQMAGKYSGNVNLNVFLKGHVGDTHKVDRKNGTKEFVLRPAVTIGLTIQPQVLCGLVNRPEFRGRGLLGRFFYALPRNMVGYREIGSPPVPVAAKNAFRLHLWQLLKSAHEHLKNKRPELRLELSPAARARFNAFNAEIEPLLRPDSKLGPIADWAGKLVGGVGRIIGLLHIAGHARANPPSEVSVEAVESGIAIGRYLICHAQAAFEAMGADPNLEGAKRVWAWVERERLSEFSKREVHQALKSRFKLAKSLDGPIKQLQEHGYIRLRPAEAQGRGRPGSPVYEVRPRLIQAGAPQNPQNMPTEGSFEDSVDENAHAEEQRVLSGPGGMADNEEEQS
jgi:hypothetical protein